LALAWIAAQGEHEAVAEFWKDLRQVMSKGHTVNEKEYIRHTSLWLRLEGMCERLGTGYWVMRKHANANPVVDWP